jgi:hypothetical protein
MSDHADTIRLAQELREALDDPKRYEWGEGPWEHLGDAERDVRKLLDGIDALAARCDALEKERDHYRFHFDQQEQRAEAAEAQHDALENALRPFAEKWDLHAAEYLTDLIDGKEVRVIEAVIVDEMIRDIETARAALAATDTTREPPPPPRDSGKPQPQRGIEWPRWRKRPPGERQET